MLAETHWLKPPTWPGTIVTICVSYSITGGPGREQATTNGRIWERPKWDTTCPTTLPDSSSLESILAEQCLCHQKSLESEWLARDNLETNLITIKPKTVSHMSERFSWVPLSCCPPLGCPFPVKSLVLSVCVCPQTIHFPLLDKSSLWSPGRASTSCNRWAQRGNI